MTVDNAPPRIILNDDGSNFLYSWDDVDSRDLRVYLSRLEGTQVDMVAWCVAFGGYVTYYESTVAEPVGSGFSFTDSVKRARWARNRARLAEEVGDYVGFAIETLGEMGIPVLASFRMNDAHMSSDPTGPVAGRFWMNHPQWRIGEPFGYYASCLDYAVPAVREYLRRLVLEVLELFPGIAGIELDGMRSPFFFRDGEGRRNAPIMTSLIREIRRDLDEAARLTGGARYLLRVNVPRSPRLALECGMDVAAWAEEELADGISPGCYNTDFQIPIEEWKELLGDGMAIHAYANCSPAMGRYMSLKDYRGAAANAWAAGADGIYLFNFPCLDELAGLIPRPMGQRPFPTPEFGAQGWHPDLTEVRRALYEVGDAETLASLDKRFLFYAQPQKYRHYVPEQAAIDRLEPEPAELVWRAFEDWGESTRARIELKLVGVTVRDQFEIRLNGEPLPENAVERLHAPNGRDARVHAIALEPYSLYVIEPDASVLRRGENTLTVVLTERDPHLFGEIEVRELEVSVRHL